MITEVAGASLAKAAEVGTSIAEAASKTVEVAAELSKQAVETAKEIADVSLNEVHNSEIVVLEPDMEKIKEQTLSSLMAKNNELEAASSTIGDSERLLNTKPSELPVVEHLDHAAETQEDIVEVTADHEGLSIEQKEQIIKETGWPPEIIEYIESMEQYEIYKEAELRFAEVNGRMCLIKDIDMDYVSPNTIDITNQEGMTNRQLLERGRPPYDAQTNESIELHHMGQEFDSPFAELCENHEHGDGNHSTLHPSKGESWRRDPALKNRYNNFDRPNHWKSRA